MPKYKAYLPVYATAEFILQTDTPIPGNELLERFIAEAEPTGSLCHQCGEYLESDFEIADYAELNTEDIVEL